MEWLLDSAKREDWQRVSATGLFSAITTNPLLIQRAGLSVNFDTYKSLMNSALELGFEHIQLQVFGDDWGSAAEQILALAERTVVKIPATEAGMQLAAKLAQPERTTITGVYSVRMGVIAERLGVRLCCHPDDPPFSLLGLPRIMSNEHDYDSLMKAVDSPANGITLCSGSLGAAIDNDLPGMMQRLGDRVHFIHLRNVALEKQETPGSFHESNHLDGNTDMVALIGAILDEEHKRKEAGRKDWCIPMRPDHGQDILDDLNRKSQPGYPAIGRLKGLAELRGVELALSSKRTLA